MKYKAVIFDLDGTLIQSIESIRYHLNHWMKKGGASPFTTEEVESLIGEGPRVLVERAYKQRKVSIPEEECYEGYLSDYLLNPAIKDQVYDGVQAMLAELEARGIFTAVLSNKPHGALKQVLKRHFPQHIFDAVQGYEPPLPRKPDPESLNRIIEKLDLPKGRILLVGDSEVDLLTAQRGGIEALSVTWGFRRREELIRSGAQNLVDHPKEILNFLEERPQKIRKEKEKA